MSNMDKSWMYQRRTERGDLNQDFIEGLETFIEFACSKPNFMDGTKIRCPCKKCRHISFEEAETVRFHLCKFGFVPNYFEWNRHGEMSHNSTSMEFDANWGLNEQNEPLESYQQMVFDAAGPNLITRNVGEEANVEDKRFFDMLFKERTDPNGYAWGQLSVDTVEFYWQEFKKHFEWDATKTALVYIAWEMKAKRRYADYISRLRKNPRPAYISPEIWTMWNNVWNSEEGKKKTELAKKNRRGGVLNGVAQSTHTTGSTPHVKVAAQLEGQLGHYQSYYELFKHTHTKQHDGQTFIVEKAKQIHEQVESQRELLTQNGEQVDDNQLYYDAVGGHDKKNL